MIYIDLLLNLSLLVALSVVSGFIDRRWPYRQKTGALLQGLLFGGASILGMLRPLVIAPGLIFDGRSVMISLCALFFGPLTGTVAAAAALIYRISLGGIGVVMGALVISASMLIGSAYHWKYRISENLPGTKRLYFFGLVVHVVMVALMFTLPGEAKWNSLSNVAPMVLIFYPLATILAGRVLTDQQRMALDIVVLKRAKDELRLFKESVDSATDAVGMSTPEGRHIYQNEAFTQLFGDVGEDPSVSIYRDKKVGRAVFEAIMAGKNWIGEVEMIDRDGQVRPIMLRAYASKDEQGEISGLVGIHSDISAQKEMQKEQEFLQAQLLQAQKMESIGRLAGGVAHDFNNMLGVIIGHVDLAFHLTQPSQALYKHLTEIGNAAHRSVALTRQLLAFARKQTVSPKVLDLNETVAGMLNMLRRLIGENIELVWSPGPEALSVLMDPSQLDQVLANLAVNARDAISGSGTLWIETGSFTVDEAFAAACPEKPKTGEYVMLTMKDNGSGMDEEIMSHLFEPFFTTKAVGKGTGLGLATSYGIISQNKGLISVSSQVGRGTEVKVLLPRHHGAPAADERREREVRIRGGKETVLLVEDEPTILEMSGLMLEQLGYRVLTACGPNAALKRSAEHQGPIHVLLTDVIMPELNGQQLSEQLQRQHPELKVIFMSGYTADIIASHGVLDKNVHYLQKPFRLEDLDRTLRQVLENQ